MTGKQANTKRQIMMRTDEKAHECLQLRREGLPYEEIASIVGYATRAGAMCAVNKLMAAEYSVTMDMVREYKHEQMLTLSELETTLMQRVGVPVIRKVRGKDVIDDDGDIYVVDRILKIMDRRAKLLGLDAPAKSDTNITHTMSHEDALDALDDVIDIEPTEDTTNG